MARYESYEIPSLRRPLHWPRSVRLTLESIIAVFVNAYQIARGRAMGNSSSTVRLLAQRDDALWRAAIAERRVELFRQRLREQKPKRPCRSRSASGSNRRTPLHVLHPKTTNRTWHLDLTALHVHGMRFHIAALMDGFSRKLVALKVYARTPTAMMMSMLVRRAVDAAGAAPRFVVTDNGTQFRNLFERSLASLAKTDVVRCRVHDFRLNGKVERFFRTMKEWARRTRPVLAIDPQPYFDVACTPHRGDPHLPVFKIRVSWPDAA